MDESALRACLGTRERPRFHVDFSGASDPECEEGPFDSDRLVVDPWSWPWTDWPLYDENVFRRDLTRVERWYRARGFYDATLLEHDVSPASAREPGERAEGDGCGDGSGDDCEVTVTIRVQEGDPVHVKRVSLRGLGDLRDELREDLREALELRHDERFDEAAYTRSMTEMRRVLAEAGYARARIRGEVKINQGRREAYIVFFFEIGPPAIFGRVCVRGMGSELNPEPIVGAAGIEPGQRFSLTAIESAQRAIYGLGTFSSVQVAPREPTPAPAPAAEPQEAHEEGEEQAQEQEQEQEETSEEEREHCTEPPRQVPEGADVVDLLVEVAPGRLQRVGIGVGIQSGQTVTLGNMNAVSSSQDDPQWDIHGVLSMEDRNMLGDLIRGRIELRPRLVFTGSFPSYQGDPQPAFRASGSLRWPAFLEARTALGFDVQYDFGPAPITNFIRHEFDARLGPERSFFDGRLFLSAAIRGNLFFPEDPQGELELDERRETAGALFFEEIARLDLRDNPREPHEGAYFSAGFQQAIPPGSWTYLRFVAEGRGYATLPVLDAVVAGRFAIGIMEVLDTNLNPDNVYQLAQLGPPSQQLRGGGASSNRGFLPGFLGDTEQLYLLDGTPIRVGGGTRRWEASLELRVPITENIGTVLFFDMGDVSRCRRGQPNCGPEFRFDRLNISLGIGLRYRTVVGPLRIDLAFRPDDIQRIGARRAWDLKPCAHDGADACRQDNYLDFGFGLVPGAFHITIGESF